jgi:hypothetical protein
MAKRKAGTKKSESDDGRSDASCVAAVRPDGTPVDLPRVLVRPGGYRFLPGGRRLVYMEHQQSPDFSLLDLDTRTARPITRLANRGALRWFDVTPDGQFLVFDRLRTSANVVLIELPKQP